MSNEREQANSIFFTKSLDEMASQQKTTAIKNILDVVDLTVSDAAARRKIRKAVLDNINDFYRMTISMVVSIAGSKDGIHRIKSDNKTE